MFPNITTQAYFAQRDNLQRANFTVGSDVILSANERKVNKILLNAKKRDKDEGLPPAADATISATLKSIGNSHVYKIIRKMPKGGMLSLNWYGMCSTRILLEFTYRDALWACRKVNGYEVSAFKFANAQPNNDDAATDESWQLMSKIREECGNEVMDCYLEKRFTLSGTTASWEEIHQICDFLNGLICFLPVFKAYFFEGLKQLADDGIQFLQLRTPLPKLYDELNTCFTELDAVHYLKQTLEEFKETCADFAVASIIYVPKIMEENIEHHINICQQLLKNYPDFVTGFDLRSFQQLGKPLREHSKEILDIVNDDMPMLLYTTETQSFAPAPISNDNLLSALILKAIRIGNGFEIFRHISIMEALKNDKMAVEVTPISNQALSLATDFSCNPCVYQLAHNIPIVVSSDYPSFLQTTPLSHDFYITFAHMAAKEADLYFLKKIVFNSFQFSGMSALNKTEAMKAWKKQWNTFILNMLPSSNALDLCQI